MDGEGMLKVRAMNISPLTTDETAHETVHETTQGTAHETVPEMAHEPVRERAHETVLETVHERANETVHEYGTQNGTRNDRSGQVRLIFSKNDRLLVQKWLLSARPVS